MGTARTLIQLEAQYSKKKGLVPYIQKVGETSQIGQISAFSDTPDRGCQTGRKSFRIRLLSIFWDTIL